MGQIKIFGNKSFLKKNRKEVSDGIHNAMVEALAFPENKRFHRFFEMDEENFIYADGRSEKYLIIEISMFEGRSIEAKKNLIRQIYKNLNKNLGISGMDIEITIFETPKENWGIRGLPGDELSLNYKIEI